MDRLLYFLIGAMGSCLVTFLFGHNKTEHDFEDNVESHCQALALSIRPNDTDISNFMRNRNEKYFSFLMIKYSSVPVEEEGLLYALLASNQFGIKEAEYYIYRCLALHPFSRFTYNFGMNHLNKGIKLGAEECISEYKRINEAEDGKISE